MIRKILVIFMALMVVGCSNSNTATVDTEGVVYTVDYEEAAEVMETTDDYVIIDVRTASEYNDEHVVGALNIPYDEITEDTMSDISLDTLIFVYCKSGNRSSKAASTLKELGYTVYDMGAFESLEFSKE